MAKANERYTARRLITKWSVYAVLLGLLILVILVDGADDHKVHKGLDMKIASALGAFITLGLYSFLFGENEVYRFLEHLVVGVVAATQFAKSLETGLYTYWIMPFGQGIKSLTGSVWGLHNLWPVVAVLLGVFALVFFRKRLWLAWLLSAACFIGGVLTLEVSRWAIAGRWTPRLLWFLAPVPGAFWYMIYSKRHLWLSRVIAVFVIGAGIGQALKALFSNFVDQALGTFKPLWDPALTSGGFTWRGLLALVGNYVFIIVMLVVLFYFVFTFRFSEHRIGRRSQVGARVFMMIAFGIVFATVVGTRMGLVTDRIYFLVEEWAKPIIRSWF